VNFQAFVADAFSQSGAEFSVVGEWQGVFSGACPTTKNMTTFTDSAHSEDKIVGITMAHSRIIRDFSNRHRSGQEKGHLVVFENDARCAVPNCGDRALDQIR
jgi:hypothetical protein